MYSVSAKDKIQVGGGAMPEWETGDSYFLSLLWEIHSLFFKWKKMEFSKNK